jgi:hypothetical protein
MSCQAPLCFTQPPQDRCRRGEGPRHEHHSVRASYHVHGRAEGPYGVLYHQDSPIATLEETVLEVRGVGGPLAFRTRQYDNVGLTFQPGKHNCGVLLLQDAEDDAQRTRAVHGAHPGERSREPGRVMPTVDHNGDTLDLVYLEPSGKRPSDSERDLLLDLGGDTPSQQ